MNTATPSPMILNPQPAEARTSPLPFAAAPTGSHTQRKRILVVDDSAVIRSALSIKLRANGYEVVAAADGAEAVSLARRQRPDLIIMDILFPADVSHGGGVSWDGFLIMQWLRRIEELARIPFIMITGDEAARNQQLAQQAGAAAFFAKPINTEELVAAIRLLLAEGSSAADPA